MPNPVNWYSLNATFANISAAPSTLVFSVPVAGFIRNVQITLFNAITVANATISFKIDNVAVTPTLTVVQVASAKGTTFNIGLYQGVKQGSLIEVISDGGSTTTCIAPVSLTFSD